MGIVTGAVEPACHVKLGRGRLNGLLSFGGFDSDASARPDIVRASIARAGEVVGRGLAPEECLIVGDTPKDVEAARAVGAPSHRTSTAASSSPPASPPTCWTR